MSLYAVGRAVMGSKRRQPKIREEPGISKEDGDAKAPKEDGDARALLYLKALRGVQAAYTARKMELRTKYENGDISATELQAEYEDAMTSNTARRKTIEALYPDFTGAHDVDKRTPDDIKTQAAQQVREIIAAFKPR